MLKLIVMFGLLAAVAIAVYGFAMVVLGLRGRPRLSEPRCAKCGYDLRGLDFRSTTSQRCPECGTDATAQSGARFGRYERQPKRVVWGLALIVFAIAAPLGLVAFIQSRPTPAEVNASRTTAQLLAALPPTLESEPWVWMELERRLKAGTLSQQEVDQAIGAVTAYLVQERTKGQVGQLAWSRNFVREAVSRQAIGQRPLVALYTALCGPLLNVRLPEAVRQGQPLNLIVAPVNSAYELLGDHRLVWAISRFGAENDRELRLISIDRRSPRDPAAHDLDDLSAASGQGVPLTFPRRYATLEHDLPIGEHVVSIMFDLGAVPGSASLSGRNRRPGTVDKWPTPIVKWQSTFTRKVRVVGKDDPLVTLVTDPSRDPMKTSAPSIEEAIARLGARGVQVVFKWRGTPRPGVAICYGVTLVAGQHRVACGSYVQAAAQDGDRYHPEQVALDALPAEVTKVDLLFEPDPRTAERSIGMDEIWGLPFTLKDIPLARYDVQPATMPASP